MSTVHKITKFDQPQFPCWLWSPKFNTWEHVYPFHPFDPKAGHTHWHPDQPTPPKETPDAPLHALNTNSSTSSASGAGTVRLVPPSPDSQWAERAAVQIWEYLQLDCGTTEENAQQIDGIAAILSRFAPAVSPVDAGKVREAVQIAVDIIQCLGAEEIYSESGQLNEIILSILAPYLASNTKEGEKP